MKNKNIEKLSFRLEIRGMLVKICLKGNTWIGTAIRTVNVDANGTMEKSFC